MTIIRISLLSVTRVGFHDRATLYIKVSLATMCWWCRCRSRGCRFKSPHCPKYVLYITHSNPSSLFLHNFKPQSRNQTCFSHPQKPDVVPSAAMSHRSSTLWACGTSACWCLHKSAHFQKTVPPCP